MARLHDSGGNLLGGMTSAAGQSAPPHEPADLSRTRLNPCFGPEETVPGLVCSFGSLAYATAHDPHTGTCSHTHLLGCHNPVEDPDERQHCAVCGGDYCSTHAECAAHDCDNVILAG